MTYSRPGPCPHPSISDEMLRERERLIVQTWGGADHLKCPACNEWLYPHGDPEEDDAVVYVGEPYGAGDDPWGRPDPGTHPEYWME